jgi:hypothetical protein
MGRGLCVMGCVGLAIVVIASGVFLCVARDEPKWSATPVKIDITKYGEYDPRLEFSADGTMVCAFWEKTYQHGDSKIGPPLRIVFNAANGKIVEEAVDAMGRLTAAYVSRFPRSVPRSSGVVHDPLDESLKASMQFPSFLRGARGWGFNSDFSLGIRLTNPRSPWNGRQNADLHTDSGYALWAAELWRLSPKRERLWTVDLPENTADLAEVMFFLRGGKKLIALALHPGEGYILSQDDGKVVERLRFNSFIDEKSPTNVIHGDATGPFKASEFSFDPVHSWLACGAFTGKGVRVFRLDDHQKPVFETGVYDDPYLPKGGVWSVGRVEFTNGGKYLIVDRRFAGRRTWKRADATDIYNTKTWQKVWTKDSEYISSVCMSPDGNKMAFVRSNSTHSKSFLEIGSFSESEAGRQGMTTPKTKSKQGRS